MPAGNNVPSRNLSDTVPWCTSDNMLRWLRGEDWGMAAHDADRPQVRTPNRAAGQNSRAPAMHFPPANRDMPAAEFARFLDGTHGVATAEQLFDLIAALALRFDCPWIAYGPLAPDRKVLVPVRGNSKVMLNYPDEWQDRCAEMGYDRIDPIKKGSRNWAAGAIRWADAFNDASTTECERRVLEEAATFGLRSGMTVPLRGPDGSFALMSFALPWESDFQGRTTTYLQLAAMHFHWVVAQLHKPDYSQEVPGLSKRERECILWAARGKSSWNIGVIMNISENTVNFHIKNAMRKMGVGSRTVAAIKALDLGIIEL
ncbi:LuxR family transcriptional regulator [Sinorhizobium medicae]|nr:LuxR family transcriptional regulator [Sinorhizobium medicae]MDX1244402.1 LuxR family transcriptional regulator [Sinorhizobium medicae]